MEQSFIDLGKDFSAFYGTGMLFTMFTGVRP
jgi:hypothetical protein